MVRKIDWASQIGRRLKLRDLHVFSTVVHFGSMAKAAEYFGVSQPAVSELMAGLEHALGVQLLDRSSRGVEPTMYGRALLKRSTVVFDELKQGIKDLEFLADPTVGELRIGCPESIAAAILQPIIERFSKLHPRVVLHVWHEVSPTRELPQLRERALDLCLVRLRQPHANEYADLNVEVLFDDETVVAAGTRSRWANRRKINLAELVDEAWILTPPDSWTYLILADAFRARSLAVPQAFLMTHSVHLRTNMAATGDFITILPDSVLRFNANRFSLKVLPVDLPVRPWPVAVVTLKNRTLSPLAQRFIDHVRAFTRSMAAGVEPKKKSA